jgi:chromosome segregation ATPase
MTDKGTGSFRLGTLDETRETAPIDDSELIDLEVGKASKRHRWLMVLMFLVIIAVFAAGYVDLKNRFSIQKTSGTRELENIAAVFQDRLDEFQKRLDDLESSIGPELAALDQKTVVSQKDLAALRQKVDKLDLSGAVKKERQALLESVRKQLAPMEQSIQSTRDELAALEKNLETKLAPLNASLTENRKTIEAIQEQVGGPSSGAIVNKDQMDLELLKIKKAYRQNIAAEIAGLEKQIRILEERMGRLEIKPSAGAAPSNSTPSGQPAAAGNASIQEQNIP